MPGSKRETFLWIHLRDLPAIQLCHHRGRNSLCEKLLHQNRKAQQTVLSSRWVWTSKWSPDIVQHARKAQKYSSSKLLLQSCHALHCLCLPLCAASVSVSDSAQFQSVCFHFCRDEHQGLTPGRRFPALDSKLERWQVKVNRKLLHLCLTLTLTHSLILSLQNAQLQRPFQVDHSIMCLQIRTLPNLNGVHIYISSRWEGKRNSPKSSETFLQQSG